MLFSQGVCKQARRWRSDEKASLAAHCQARRDGTGRHQEGHGVFERVLCPQNRGHSSLFPWVHSHRQLQRRDLREVKGCWLLVERISTFSSFSCFQFGILQCGNWAIARSHGNFHSVCKCNPIRHSKDCSELRVWEKKKIGNLCLTLWLGLSRVSSVVFNAKVQCWPENCFCFLVSMCCMLIAWRIWCWRNLTTCNENDTTCYRSKFEISSKQLQRYGNNWWGRFGGFVHRVGRLQTAEVQVPCNKQKRRNEENLPSWKARWTIW